MSTDTEVSVQEPTLTELLSTAAVQAAMLELLTNVNKDLRSDVLARLLEKAADPENPAKSFNVKVGDETIGTATLPEGTDKFIVSDAESFTDYVIDNHPSEVETVPTVRKNFQEILLARLIEGDDGEAVDPETGEVIPGVKFKKAGQATSFTLNFKGGKAGKAALAEQIAKNGAGVLLGITTGGDQ